MNRVKSYQNIRRQPNQRYKPSQQYPILINNHKPELRVSNNDQMIDKDQQNNQYYNMSVQAQNQNQQPEEQLIDNIGFYSRNKIRTNNQNNHIYELEDCKLSPIINTCIESKNQREEYFAQHNRKNTRTYQRHKSPSWKSFINPDVQKYYEQIVGKKKLQQHIKAAQKNTKNQYHTPKNKNNSQYSLQADLNPSVQLLQQQQNQLQEKRPTHKSHKSQILSVENENENQRAAKSTRNKSTIQNQLDAEANRNIQNIKKKYEDKISILQHQNTNLKDQLFYLRAAILAQYQAKQATYSRTNSRVQ